MNKKLRVDGMTVDATQTYSGKVVLRLLEVSFENGRRSVMDDCGKEFSRGYAVGYADGKEAGLGTAKKLRDALREVL